MSDARPRPGIEDAQRSRDRIAAARAKGHAPVYLPKPVMPDNIRVMYRLKSTAGTGGPHWYAESDEGAAAIGQTEREALFRLASILDAGLGHERRGTWPTG